MTPSDYYHVITQGQTLYGRQCAFFILFFSFSFIFYRYIVIHLMAQNQQQRLLAIGDSLTAGYYDSGRNFHPYANRLSELFSSAQIPVIIDQRGVSGERVTPTMAKRLENLLKTNTSYDWIIILGGTNDLGMGTKAERIFRQGLEPMYEMVFNQTKAKPKLVAMTVIENGYEAPTDGGDTERQALNTMIRDYVTQAKDQDRVCLVDLDKGIPYHAIRDVTERQRIWSDRIHLQPAGYDRMATLIFESIKSKLSE